MSNVADGIVDRLRAWGVHRVFGYAGDGVDPLLASLHRAEQGIEFVSARHEEMAAFMACGNCSQSRVLPSISVKSKVSVPEGRAPITQEALQLPGQVFKRHEVPLRPASGVVAERSLPDLRVLLWRLA